MDMEKNISSENSNSTMMTVEIPVINPCAIQIEKTAITTEHTSSPISPTPATKDIVDSKMVSSVTPLAPMDAVDSQAPSQHTTQQQMQTNNTTDMTDSKDKMDPQLANFQIMYVLTQLVGITMIILMGCWIGVHLGGLAGTSYPLIEFNWHPLLMTIGLIFLYGNAILVYRGFRSMRKKTLKITHAAIHMAAFILTVIALKTAFDSHNLLAEPRPNMYSLHSWLGLSAVILFCLQYVVGFAAYLVPGAKESLKATIMPLHIYFGLFGFILAIAAALMGITEKAIFSVDGYSNLPSSGVMANLCGVFYVIFGGLVIYLATNSAYKRKPIPEDTALLTNGAE